MNQDIWEIADRLYDHCCTGDANRVTVFVESTFQLEKCCYRNQGQSSGSSWRFGANLLMAVLSVINDGMLIIMQGKFIILEGIDGSGKTTIAEMLTDRLQQEGKGANFLNKKYSDYPEGFLREFTKKIGDALWTPTHGAPVTDVTDFGWYYLHATWYSVLANNALRNSLEEFEYTIMDGWYYKILARFLAKDKYEAADLALPFKHLPKGIWLCT